MKTSKKESVWFDESSDDALRKIASGTHSTVSDAIRKLVDKGMKTEGYKVEDDRLYDMVETWKGGLLFQQYFNLLKTLK